MRYFPLFFDLQHRNVLVVGGGEQAARKLRLIARTGARITVIAREVSPEIEALASRRPLTFERRRFAAEDVRNRDLVFAADSASDAEVAAAARAYGIPVNVVDAPELSTVIVPAIVDRDPVVVAIGTEGAAPVIGRDLRARIEAWLPAALGDLARKAANLRPRVREAIADANLRRRFWEQLLRGTFRTHVLAGNSAGADRTAEAELERMANASHATGRVTLIGCGPGDPDLLTLKALQHLQDADVLIYDRLVDARVLDYARRDAVRIDVGKAPGGRSASQDEINRVLVREALKGHRVARLKGGDAMIFGRAAEEIAAVRAAGIAVEIVPGVTAAHACAAAIGLPLTLRGSVRHFSIATGASEHGAPELDWQALAGAGQAVAIYMGVRTAPTIERQLRAAGIADDTPVIIVENGTLPGERAVATTLADLAAAVASERIKGPAIIFVGLDWSRANLSTPSHVRTFRLPPRSGASPQSGVAAEIARQA